MIGGFNPERIGIAMGETGFGKTNLAINLALAAARTMGVAYVNMEMGYADMVKRFAVIGAQVNYRDYGQGAFDPGAVKNRLSSVADKIQITSGKALSLPQISAWARLRHRKNPLGLLVIDYDQKVDLRLGFGIEEWKELQKAVEAFEALAMELGIYVLLLAQVNREGKIAGSFRALYPAHTALRFREHETHGPIIEAVKNRHGKKSQALTVLYNQENSSLIEGDVITLTNENNRPATKSPWERNSKWINPPSTRD